MRKKRFPEEHECDLGSNKITLTWIESRNCYQLQEHNDKIIYHADFIDKKTGSIIEKLISEIKNPLSRG
jgi:prephenate dehydratase